MSIIVTKNYHPINSANIEEKFKVSYIGDFCIKSENGDWSNTPVSIYYQENPNISLGHTNYLGVGVDYIFDGENMIPAKIYLTNGESAFSEGLIGVVADNGDIIVSCYRNDAKTSPDGSVKIDGGRDYVKTSTDAEIVKLKVLKGKIVLDEQY